LLLLHLLDHLAQPARGALEALARLLARLARLRLVVVLLLVGGLALRGRGFGLKFLRRLFERLLLVFLAGLLLRFLGVLGELLALLRRLLLLLGEPVLRLLGLLITLLVALLITLGIALLAVLLLAVLVVLVVLRFLHLLVERVLLRLQFLGAGGERLHLLLVAQLLDQVDGALEVAQHLLVLLAPLRQVVLERLL